MSQSTYLNLKNVENVRKMISKKEGTCIPFYATVCNTESVITDMDTHPYPRFFRGRYDSDQPIVAERESGFRVRDDQCYRVTPCTGCEEQEYPSHCFEVACSTVFPCNPKDTIHSPLVYELYPYKTCINIYR
jgi:hypothetical protein